MPAIAALLDRRLIFVTGKGGVGKSTVALALGMLATRAGLRTIVAELAGDERLARTFDVAGEPFEEIQIVPGLFTISIDPERAMEEYLRVKTGPVGQALGHSRLFQAFAMATPGMRELLSIGKVWELAQLERRTRDAAPYDLVVLDSPASGHGLGVLRTPRTFAEIARVGPIAHQGRVIASTIADPAFTAIVAVTTPDEMPVNETLWIREALDQDELALAVVIANACYPERFTAPEAVTLASARGRAPARPERAAIAAALSEHSRAVRQREQLSRLQDGVGAEVIELPYLFSEEIGPPEIGRLADALQEGLAGLASPTDGG